MLKKRLSSAISDRIRKELVFYVNGKEYRIPSGLYDPQTPLIDFLRSEGYTSVKLGCGEGGCGACTAVITDPNTSTGIPDVRSVNTCITTLMSVDGKSITTTEGLSDGKDLHPIQESFVNKYATQCGACTPGFIMRLYDEVSRSLLKKGRLPRLNDIENCFDGNICRCTGNRPILEAARDFSIERNYGNFDSLEDLLGKFKPLPSKLPAVDDRVFKYEGKKPGQFYIAPRSFDDFLEVKSQYKNECLIIVGNSEAGVEYRFKGKTKDVVLDPRYIKELREFTVSDNSVTIGACLPYTDILENLERQVYGKVYPAYRTLNLKEFTKILKYIASRQVRNSACLAGNMVTASPLADANPALIALGAKVKIINATTHETRTILAADFFKKKYRSVNLSPEEVIVSIEIPFSESPDDLTRFFKITRRKEDDICIVTACFRYDSKNDKAHFAFNGVSPYVVKTPKSEAVYEKTRDFDKTVKSLLDEIGLEDNSPGGNVEYRRNLIKTLFYKFYSEHQGLTGKPRMQSILRDVKSEFEEKTFSITLDREYEDPDDMIPHINSKVQVTGEAKFVDDLVKPKGTLYAAPVFSTVPHGRIISIDFKPALEMEGVVDYVTSHDVPGENRRGEVELDEPVFAENEVHTVGQMIALVIAEDLETAKRAAARVKVEYEELDAILSIEEAIEKNSQFRAAYIYRDDNLELDWGEISSSGDTEKTIRRLDPIMEEKFKECDHVLEGEMNMHGQEHFYIETHTSLAIPGEDGAMEILSSTQNPAHTQHEVSHVLGVDSNRIVCRVKRLGGAFGGKEARSHVFASAVAVAANKLGVPVHISLERDVDMLMSGQRHGYKGKYRVGFDKDGRIKVVDMELFSNAGWSLDLSNAVMDRSLYHADAAYYIPTFRVVGRTMKTNLPSNTAFRTFGGVQAPLVMESAIDNVARFLNMDPQEIREKHLYKENDKTIFRQTMEDCQVRKAWKTVGEGVYEKLKREVEEFNAENKYKKRGIAMIPLKFGISFTFSPLNQSGALVLIYNDGKVLATHGGVEMGQGLYTKMAQIVAKELDIPVSEVFIAETSTDKIPNTSATAASTGSDLNGMALRDACRKLRGTLDEYRAKYPEKSWKEIANQIWFDQKPLIASGFYGTPGLNYNIEDPDISRRGDHPFHYFTWGASLSVVEIDSLTGEHKIIRSDVVCDVGQSLNPKLDIGQVEGAFVQGYGWLTTEDIVFGDHKPENQWIRPGYIQNLGPGYYKVPLVGDLPLEMNIKLLQDSKCETNINSSKAVGEPPFVLGSSVFFAIKDAVHQARKEFLDDATSDVLEFDAPASCINIGMNCLAKLEV